jgi:hypothetical protein
MEININTNKLGDLSWKLPESVNNAFPFMPADVRESFVGDLTEMTAKFMGALLGTLHDKDKLSAFTALQTALNSFLIGRIATKLPQ